MHPKQVVSPHSLLNPLISYPFRSPIATMSKKYERSHHVIALSLHWSETDRTCVLRRPLPYYAALISARNELSTRRDARVSWGETPVSARAPARDHSNTHTTLTLISDDANTENERVERWSTLGVHKDEEGAESTHPCSLQQCSVEASHQWISLQLQAQWVTISSMT